jgi:hypothetical protein
MKSHSINKLENFIAGWYIEDVTICDELIHFFNTKAKKQVGEFSGDSSKECDLKKKNSTDALLQEPTLLNRYLNSLQKVADEYKKLYVYSNLFVNVWGLKDYPQIQYYKPPEGGYHSWHTERAGQNADINRRHLVYMTYLNDVADGGETEWYYQKLKIKPEKGLTIIWPVDWPFTHRGLRSPTQEKYIVTGWYHFKEFI